MAKHITVEIKNEHSADIARALFSEHAEDTLTDLHMKFIVFPKGEDPVLLTASEVNGLYDHIENATQIMLKYMVDEDD